MERKLTYFRDWTFSFNIFFSWHSFPEDFICCSWAYVRSGDVGPTTPPSSLLNRPTLGRSWCEKDGPEDDEQGEVRWKGDCRSVGYNGLSSGEDWDLVQITIFIAFWLVWILHISFGAKLSIRISWPLSHVFGGWYVIFRKIVMLRDRYANKNRLNNSDFFISVQMTAWIWAKDIWQMAKCLIRCFFLLSMLLLFYHVAIAIFFWIWWQFFMSPLMKQHFLADFLPPAILPS